MYRPQGQEEPSWGRFSSRHASQPGSNTHTLCVVRVHSGKRKQDQNAVWSESSLEHCGAAIGQRRMSHLSLSPPSTSIQSQSPSLAASSCTSAGGVVAGGGVCPSSEAGLGNGGSTGGDGAMRMVLQRRLGSELSRLVSPKGVPAELEYSDAEVVVAEGVSVRVHRCILAARSPFFRRIFAGLKRKAAPIPSGGGEQRPEKRKERSGGGAAEAGSGGSAAVKVDLGEVVKGGKIGRQCFAIVLGLLYGGRLNRGVLDGQCGICCMDPQCPHSACWPVVEFYLELLFAASAMELAELKSVAEQHLLKLVLKAMPESVLQMLVVAGAQRCQALEEACLPAVAGEPSLSLLSVDKSGVSAEVARQVAAERKRLLGMTEEADMSSSVNRLRCKVYKALDCDDIELMQLLLKEAGGTVDSVCALHYAAAYCDVKTFGELLELGCGDVNLRDATGHTVLHAAALRRDPQIIGLALGKGAQPHDTTPAGFTALQLARRMTRNTGGSQEGQEGEEVDEEEEEETRPPPPPPPREEWRVDKICVEMLEQAENVNPCPVFPDVPGNKELLMRLLYLENRVAFARLLWPRECKVVLSLSQVEATKEFTTLTTDDSISMDLNKEPTTWDGTSMNQLVQRVKALQRAIEVGHRFFPRCTAILNQYMDDGSNEHALIQNRRIPEGQLLAKRRRVSEDEELKSKFAQAFQRDVEEHQQKQLSTKMM